MTEYQWRGLFRLWLAFFLAFFAIGFVELIF